MTTTQNPIVGSYLRRLDAALSSLPDDERRQIRDGIEEHVAAALAELDSPTEAEIRGVLARLGDPETIAAEAHERVETKSAAFGLLTKALLWIGAIVGVFDLLMVSTSRIGPVEFAFLAVPVIALFVVAIRLGRHWE